MLLVCIGIYICLWNFNLLNYLKCFLCKLLCRFLNDIKECGCYNELVLICG